MFYLLTSGQIFYCELPLTFNNYGKSNPTKGQMSHIDGSISRLKGVIINNEYIVASWLEVD